MTTPIQGGQHGITYQGRVPQFGELNQPRAVRDAAREVGRRPDRQPGLPHTTWPDQGHQARDAEFSTGLGQLMATADEARRLGGQVSRRDVELRLATG
jgi:hypothetical protein